MCIIVAIKPNTKAPSKNTLKHCFEYNNDGSGFAWYDGLKYHVEKGYKTFSKFYKDFKKVYTANRKSAFILHFRITTQCNEVQCTQPFPLSANMDTLKQLSYTGNKPIIAHNGIIGLTSVNGKVNFSDTMLFVASYLANQSIETIKSLCKEHANTSRFAILKDNDIVLIGDNWIEENGIYYSNESYKKTYYQPTYKPTMLDWDKDKANKWVYDWDGFTYDELSPYDKTCARSIAIDELKLAYGDDFTEDDIQVYLHDNVFYMDELEAYGGGNWA